MNIYNCFNFQEHKLNTVKVKCVCPQQSGNRFKFKCCQIDVVLTNLLFLLPYCLRKIPMHKYIKRVMMFMLCSLELTLL